VSEEIIGRFKAVDDETGKVYKVLVYQNFIEHMNKGGCVRVPGMKRFATSTGLSVNRIDDQTFEIFDTGQRLRKLRKRDVETP